MKIKLTNLKNNVMGIYKINFPNGKIYIGLSVDIKRRVYEHNNPLKAKTPCDLAIVKYGKIKEIEILELCKNKEILSEREKYWINYYNSTNKNVGYNITKGGTAYDQSGENNLRAVFSNEEVYDIRKRRFYGERNINVYKDYSDRNFGTFEKVWLGKGYPDIGTNFIIETNSISRQKYSSKANSGENNGRAKLTKEDVIKIRKRYDKGEMPSKIHKDYSFVCLDTIARVCRRETWKSV